MNQTLINLTKAFVGESQARNRYNMYASVARKEGLLQIAEIFEVTALQEKEHASRFFKMIQMVQDKLGLSEQEIDIATSAFVKKGTTLENLQFAIDGETHEWDSLYPEFAQIAEDEGFPEIAARIRSIAVAEQHHAERYHDLRHELQAETLRAKGEEVEWMCTKCGYVHKGKTPPAACPSCGHDQTYFQLRNEKY